MLLGTQQRRQLLASVLCWASNEGQSAKLLPVHYSLASCLNLFNFLLFLYHHAVIVFVSLRICCAYTLMCRRHRPQWNGLDDYHFSFIWDACFEWLPQMSLLKAIKASFWCYLKGSITGSLFKSLLTRYTAARQCLTMAHCADDARQTASDRQ